MAGTAIFYRAMLRRHFQSFARQQQQQQQQQQQRRWQSNKPETPIPGPNNVPATDVPFWLKLGPLTRATQAYGRAQRKRPWVVQLCTSLTIFCLGDVSAQHMSGKGYDPERTGRSMIIGGLISIPNFEWFMFLSRNFNYSSWLLSLATKITINQCFFTPLFNTYFFGMQAFLAGDNLVEIWERIKRTVPISIVNSLKVWPAVSAINFTFIPIEYRSIFAGTIAVGWQTYLSWLNRLAEEAEARDRPAGRIPPSSSADMMTA